MIIICDNRPNCFAKQLLLMMIQIIVMSVSVFECSLAKLVKAKIFKMSLPIL